jgi:hypothetical protein
MNRDQLSEEEWLASTRASSLQHRNGDTTTTDSIVSVPLLVDEAVLSRDSDAKKRSAESTRALLKLNASLSAEVDELTLKLDKSKQVVMTLLGLLNENNIDVDMDALGLEDLLDSSSSSTNHLPTSLSSSLSSKTSANLQFESDSFIADVLTEGDGVTVSKAKFDFRPHDKANILCVRVLQPMNDEMIVITGGADKRIIASSVLSKEDSQQIDSAQSIQLLDTLILTAPVLCLDVRGNVILAGCMDGSLHLLSFGDGRDRDSISKSEDEQVNVSVKKGLTFFKPYTLKAHEKYITRVMSSPRSGIVASASSDKSLSLFKVIEEEGRGGKRLHRLQQLFFAKGGVEAIEWAVEHDSDDLIIETLAISVRSSPVLYYLRFVTTSRGNAEVDQLSSILSAGGFGSQVSFLVDSFNDVPQNNTSSASNSTKGAYSSSNPSTEQMWLYRVPLSEDGQRVDCSWKHLYSFYSLGGGVDGDAIKPRLINDDDVRDLESSQQNVSALQLSSSSSSSSSLLDKDDIDGDAKRVRDALRGKHVTSTIDGELIVSSSTSISQGYIRVGFTVIALACEPYLVPDIPSFSSSTSSSSSSPLVPPLLAIAADNGACYIVRFGSNEIIRTLVGHSVGSAVSASTKVSWHPQGKDDVTKRGYSLSSSLSSAYLAVTSESDYSIVLYSIGSGKIAKRLGKSEGGHSGSIKDVTFVEMRGWGGEGGMSRKEERGLRRRIKRRMVTVSFDKRCVVWD